MGTAGIATTTAGFSSVASAGTTDKPYLNDEGMTQGEKYRYISRAHRSNEFNVALDEVRKRGFTEITETTGVVRTGSLVNEPIKIIGFSFTKKDSGEEAMISTSFTNSDETNFGIHLYESNTGLKYNHQTKG